MSLTRSQFAAALHHGRPRRRGRRPPASRARGRDPVVVAEDHGVDVSLLREALERAPAERLARLDANAAFLRALRPVPSESSRPPRPRERRRR